MADPYNVYGGLQDNNSYRGPSRTHRYHGILNRDWQVIDYGDGMYVETDLSDTGVVYVTSQNAGIMRVDLATGDRKSLRPFPRDTADEHRFDWKSPILVSPHDPNRVYLGGNRLFISDDRGESWRATDDLTRGLHQDSLPIMGILPDSATLSKHDGASRLWRDHGRFPSRRSPRASCGPAPTTGPCRSAAMAGRRGPM